MEYNFLYNDEEFNELYIPMLKGKDVPAWYDGDIIDSESEEFYYELYLVKDENGKFDHAEIQKIGGAEYDDVHGSCYYDELDKYEQEMVLSFVLDLFNVKKWTATVKLYGEEETKILDLSFYIDDALAEKIEKWSSAGNLLCDSDFYKELENLAYESIGKALREDAINYYEDEKPDKDLYDEDEQEEYDEALEEYNSLLEDYGDEFSVEELVIFDPNREKQFIRRLIGNKLINYDNKLNSIVELHFESSYPDDKRFDLKIKVDDNDYIVDVFEMSAIMLTSESLKSSRFEECDFDYDFVYDCLEEENLE